MRSGLLLASVVVVAGCSPKYLERIEAVVGVDGGTVTLSNGAQLIVPPEALDSDVTLTFALREQWGTSEQFALSPVYEIGPAGTVFAHPVKVRFPVEDSSADSVFWSRPDGKGYEAIGGGVAEGSIEAEILRLNSGFIGKSSGVRTITGANVVTWVTENAIHNLGTDLTGLEVKALVENPDGTFTEYPGVGRADGTFSIEGVPATGAFYLQNGSTYTVTSRSVVDVGQSLEGRPTQRIPTASTTLAVNATNLAPWQAGDRLQLFSTNANAWYFDIQDIELWSVPAPGETTLDTGVDTARWRTPLIDGTHGDRATLSQLSLSTSDTGVPYTAVSRVLTFDAFSQVEGSSLAISGAMTPVASDHQVSFDWRITAFEAYGSTAVPVVGTTKPELSVMGHPGGTSRGFYSNTADFLLMRPPSGQDLNTGIMHYGTPLTGTWGTSVLARMSFPYFYQLPGTTQAREVLPFIDSVYTLDQATAGPLAPMLSPVRNIRVNGASAKSPLTGVAPRPEVAWDPPALGTPNMYTVELDRLFVDGTATRLQRLNKVSTPYTKVRIPDGLMLPGETYALRIYARNSSVTTPDTPYRYTVPEAGSVALTETITMAP